MVSEPTLTLFMGRIRGDLEDQTGPSGVATPPSAAEAAGAPTATAARLTPSTRPAHSSTG